MALSDVEKYYLSVLKKDGKEPVICQTFGDELMHYYDVFSEYKKLELDDLMGFCTRYRMFVRVKSIEEAKKVIYIAKKSNYKLSKKSEEIDSIPLEWLCIYFSKNNKTYEVMDFRKSFMLLYHPFFYFKEIEKYIGYLLDDYKVE